MTWDTKGSNREKGVVFGFNDMGYEGIELEYQTWPVDDSGAVRLFVFDH
jgi:hypothetical protein